MRSCALLVAAIVSFALAPASAQQPPPKKEEFQTAAPFAILIEAESGAVLFEKSADQPMFPSSMAKLMTAEVVFQAIKQKRLTLEDEVTISENAWRKGGAPSGGSTMYAQLNSRVKVHDLIRSMVIQSGNDACIALAEAMSGNEPTFATAMNKRAQEIGLTKSNFANSTGLPDPAMKVTARDLSRLARHLIREYPEFYPLYSEREFTWNKIKQQNRNPLLALGIGADGLKTGYTSDAGYGLVGSAVQNGLRLIVVVNGLKTAKDRSDEARKILEFGFRGFESRELFRVADTVGEVKVYGGTQGSVNVVATSVVKLLLQRGANEKVSAKIVYSGPVKAPVEKGQRIGVVKVWRGDHLSLEVPLEAGESVPAGTLVQRALDAASEFAIGLFRAGVKRI
ncbi:D-alanyl-D-alanine carboxypeptidase family protein [Variibacter gotjawalensis]|nr:D-alanyl-D-alanine carboxypeptidase family protein [Variibacter gotjawalensis]NIK46301.1 D-alanyl-D-alanine carboxypeptidase (penicillin-binding protein 5/6) [Variibacter gotjawalensis]